MSVIPGFQDLAFSFVYKLETALVATDVVFLQEGSWEYLNLLRKVIFDLV